MWILQYLIGRKTHVQYQYLSEKGKNPQHVTANDYGDNNLQPSRFPMAFNTEDLIFRLNGLIYDY
jgi:hypothetical protein